MTLGKLNTPNTPSSNRTELADKNISPWRERFKYVLGGIVIGAIGVLGVQAINVEKKPVKKDSVSDGDRDAGAKNQLSLKDKIDTINGARGSVLQWDDEPEDTEVCRLEDMDPDDIIDESQYIIDERNEKLANDLIAKLGITNENDKQAIIDAFLDGCTKVYSVTEKDVYLEDPEMEYNNCSGTIDFEEEIEVPEEYVDDSIVKTEQELELEELIDDEKYEEVLNSVDFDEAFSAAEKEGCLDSYGPGLRYLEEIKNQLLQATTPEDRLRIACTMMFKLEQMTDQLENDRCDDNEQLASVDRIIQMYVNSIGQIGFEGDDDQCYLMFIQAGFEKYDIDLESK